MAQPADAAGGAPAWYSKDILDLMKFGIGAVVDTNKSQQLFDYKKFEATNGGLYPQGQPANVPRAAQGGGVSGLVMLGIGAIVVLALLTHKV